MPLRNCSTACLVSLAMAIPLAFAQAPFPVVSTVDAPEIAGRPVQLDAAGKLLPWPIGTDTGYSYNSYLLAQWSILWDQYNRQRYPYFYCCFDFDRTTFEMQPDNHWANSTAYLRAMMQGFIERLYPYTGDPNTIAFLEDFMNYELENGLTPEGYAWPRVPYTSANPGDRRYTGWSKHGEDYIEPHVVGEDGYAYLRFYEMTGNTKYLEEAIRCAEALVKNYRPGDAKKSPWPVRCYARDGGLNGPGMGPYSANVVEPVMLFDELIRLGYGDTAAYRSVRQKAWEWLQEYPMKNNVWVGYFEDVKPSMENMNQVIPLEYARYVVLHPDKDPQWREHAERLIEWVKKTPKWPKYIVHGAMVTTEQGNGKTYCCNIPNQCCDSHTSRLAAVEALLARRTGDAALRESAFRSYNWVTYFQGMPPRAHAPFSNQWWFTDQFSDGPRRLMDGLSAFPEWAPSDESHLVGSTSVVTKIAYGKGSVAYSTFDPASTDVLRLNFTPQSVWAGGRKLTHLDRWNEDALNEEGYTVDDAHILRIRHTQSRDVDIQGDSDEPVPLKVDFDNPHLAVGSALTGQYPSGVIDWGESAWEVAGPEGKMSTFSIRAAQAAGNHAEFKFANPRMLVWIEAYNSSEKEVELTISSPEMRELTVSLQAGELRRIRTQWTERVSATRFDSPNLAALRFDNIGYSLYLLGQPYR